MSLCKMTFVTIAAAAKRFADSGVFCGSATDARFADSGVFCGSATDARFVDSGTLSAAAAVIYLTQHARRLP